MSYDIFLEATPCSQCGRADPGPGDLPEPTYNLTPIFDRALTGEDLPNADVSEMEVVVFGESTDRPRGLRLLTGKRAGDTVRWLEKAVAQLKDADNAPWFRKLEPENRWGTLADAVWVMERLLEAAREYPEHVWNVR